MRLPRFIVCLCFILSCALVGCDSKADNEDSARSRVSDTYLAEIGVREKTGKNDGPRVEGYLRSVGLESGAPYCAAYIHWCFSQNGIDSPKSGYSPDWFKTNVIYRRNKVEIVSFPQASVFGIWFESKKRVAHVGFVHKDKGKEVETCEGNTNDALSRDGDGVYKKIRLKSQIYIVSDWVTNNYISK